MRPNYRLVTRIRIDILMILYAYISAENFIVSAEPSISNIMKEYEIFMEMI